MNRFSREASSQGEFAGAQTILQQDQQRVPPDLLGQLKGHLFGTISADPPWQYRNRTGKIAPEHRRLHRYATMPIDEICALPVAQLAASAAHIYLWTPNALLPEGLRVLQAWGFDYKTNLFWHKVRKDGGSDGRGVGFYFATSPNSSFSAFAGRSARTLAPGRRQVNYLASRKREHSRKPDQLYEIIERCSPGPYLELFARGARPGWVVWGDQALADFPALGRT